jgi:TonB family protein
MAILARSQYVRRWTIMVRSTGRFFIAVLMTALYSCTPLQAYEGGVKTFAFANPQYIITAEVASAHSFVLNVFNLSDFVIVLQPNEFIYRSSSGRFYIGQVFEKEGKDTRGEITKYAASFLLKGRAFAGLTILGDFRELDQVEELSIRVGAKRFYLQALDKSQFDQLAAKVENGLELTSPNLSQALQEANIQEMGTIKGTDGTSEWDRDWQGLVRTDGLNQVKIIEHPEIPATEEARKSNTYGRVRLQGIVNKNGALQDVKVEKGLGRGLDDRAIEGVKNSWVFLPATKNGEVIETSVFFDVPFPPPPKK